MDAAETPRSGSVFASLISGATPQRPGSRPVMGEVSAPVTERRPSMGFPDSVPVPDVPLSDIGFGPGMLLRLGQLGLHTAADLARTDAVRLRMELGEISRLLNVEAWIQRARESAQRA